MRTRPRHRTRLWAYEDVIYRVDHDFTDDILLRANRLAAEVDGAVCSICVGHAPSELALNGGRNTGGGTEHGHLRLSVPHPWDWLPLAVELSSLPDTALVHTVNYRLGQPTAYVELTCMMPSNTRNLSKRLRWWDALLALAQRTALDLDR